MNKNIARASARRMALLSLGLMSFALCAQEKQPDTADYRANSSGKYVSKAATTGGSLTVANPTFNRVFAGGVDNGCNLAAPLSGVGTNVHYQVFEIHSPVGELLDVSVDLGSLSDSTLTMYCSFDPAQPDQNVVTYDDDDGVGLGSAVPPADGVMLQPNVSYFLVVSAFGNGQTGTFTLNLGGGILLGPPVGTGGPILGPVGLILMSLLLGGLGLRASRRR